jgi:hypothetical protein
MRRIMLLNQDAQTIHFFASHLDLVPQVSLFLRGVAFRDTPKLVRSNYVWKLVP